MTDARDKAMKKLGGGKKDIWRTPYYDEALRKVMVDLGNEALNADIQEEFLRREPGFPAPSDIKRGMAIIRRRTGKTHWFQVEDEDLEFVKDGRSGVGNTWGRGDKERVLEMLTLRVFTLFRHAYQGEEELDTDICRLCERAVRRLSSPFYPLWKDEDVVRQEAGHGQECPLAMVVDAYKKVEALDKDIAGIDT